MFNDASTPLSLLRTRRSGKPRDLIAPGPDAGQLQQILEIALRTPDHGKLAPWRFVIVPLDQRGRLADLLVSAYRREKPDAGRLELEAMHQFAHQAPTLVVALSAPVLGSKIPVWEQELSSGAAIMNLLHASHALGFAAGWLTGWPAYNEDVRAAFAPAGKRIAGFIFIGTPGKPQEERPRPVYDEIVSVWNS
ncbi:MULTISPECIES: nitroreductase family protein [Sphingobium]|uniref:Putative NAD(P)H nitroreductase n=1 Tax=Sphingobium tyrosinilyticum TaxID=2715436 RepID=A0ABV9EYD2_9SPHN|nr:nitroreductase [Sphingobium sp. EP60837]ANI77025.1 Putative NAD(P)H nitroreductase [Sphingobium sp. EP60837]